MWCTRVHLLIVLLIFGVFHMISCVRLPSTPLSPYGDCFGSIYSGRGVAIGPIVLWSTLFPTQQSTSEITLREFPWMLKWVIHDRHVMLQEECILHCTSPEKGIQAEYYMQADTQANLCILMLVGPVSASKPKFQYLHRNWFQVVLVPCLSDEGQSRLFWGVLPAALGVTNPDNPASAGTPSKGGAGVSEVVFPTPAMELSVSPCTVRIHGKQIVSM